MISRKSFWVFGLLAGAVVFLTQFCTPAKQHTTANYLNHNDTVSYVGMEVCGTCHLDKVQTFVHTGMGLSFDSASRSKGSANLNSNHLLHDSIHNFYYYPHWVEDKLYVTEFRLHDADTVYKRTEEISYIIGSGQHTNSHLIKKGNFIVQAPFTWYAQKEKLDFPPGFENGANSRFSRVIDQECVSCHNGLPIMLPGSKKAFSYVPNGIDCERCHGPGSLHVSNRLTGVEPEGENDFAIVNPSKLDWERQIDVCQRCHLQGNNVLKPEKTFNDFRPGMVLSDVFEIYLPEYEGDQQLFNMANHADRFQHSQCFIKTTEAGQSFTCITCHNPHVSVTETVSITFNKACISCHPSQSDCKESITVRQAKRDNCITCHMPKSGTEDIPHVTVHDHKIAIHNSTKQKETQRVVGLYSVNNPNPEIHTLIEAYLTYYEKFDPLPIYQQKAFELLKESDDVGLWIHYYYQKQDWPAIVDLVNDDKLPELKPALLCYRVGKAFNGSMLYAKAAQWLKLAVINDPNAFDYKSELGAAYLKLDNFIEAEKVLKASISQYDNYVPAYNNLGYLFIRTGKYSQAKKKILKSLILNPDNIRGMENLVLLFGQLSDADNELKWIKKILDQNPTHDAALMRYSQLTALQ